MINTVIFDIGNVMVEYDWKGYLASFEFPEDEYRAIANAMFLHEDWNEMDRGVLSYDEILARFISHAPQYAEDIAKVLKNLGQCIHQYAYSKPWIRELHEKGLHVYYLSNYGAYALQETKEELDFRTWMDGGLFSYEVQMIKPNIWIYAEFCRRFKINPEEAVFFDDNPVNAAAASRYGLHGITFTSYEQAKEELKKLGVQ